MLSLTVGTISMSANGPDSATRKDGSNSPSFGHTCRDANVLGEQHHLTESNTKIESDRIMCYN
jgi:hypothetical protein